MSGDMITIIVLSVAVVFVFGRLWSVLGRQVGSERPDPRPETSNPPPRTQAPDPYQRRDSPPPAPVPAGPPMTFEGVEELMRADPTFDPHGFLGGAKSAYELIVGAFGTGDKATLQPLLSERVYTAWASAIDARGSSGERGPELVRLKSAEIVGASVVNTLAKVIVRFEAELAEGAHGLRDAQEKWTFEREVRSRNPNWLLSGVKVV
jgi:predicted lipid-binding transport protein (Tim44 family)